jgi:hypothetical protein
VFSQRPSPIGRTADPALRVPRANTRVPCADSGKLTSSQAHEFTSSRARKLPLSLRPRRLLAIRPSLTRESGSLAPACVPPDAFARRRRWVGARWTAAKPAHAVARAAASGERGTDGAGESSASDRLSFRGLPSSTAGRGLEMRTAPPAQIGRGRSSRRSAQLLRHASHARQPPTGDQAEGAAKKEKRRSAERRHDRTLY